MGALDLNTAEFTLQTESLDAGLLHVAAFTGREEISRPFAFHIELVSDSPDVDIDAQVGSRATLCLRGRLPSGQPYSRYIQGIVERFEHVGVGIRQSVYQATLVPSLFPLHYTRNARIFQRAATPDIVQSVLKEGGLAGDQIHVLLHSEYAARGYCVQYQESDLNFLSRLLEDEGIFYFFEHTAETDVLVLGDGAHAVSSVPQAEVLSHFDKANLYQEGVQEFRIGVVMRPGRVTLRDFRFKQPGLDMEAKQQSQRFQELEVYQFPGRYVEPGLGSRLARLRMEEIQHDRQRYMGVSNCRALQPGHKFTLQGHRRPDCNQEYLIISVEHEGSQPQAYGEEQASGRSDRPNYQARLTCIPMSVPYRPHRVTPRPAIGGVQTAVVVGPPGEEIHCDDHGRVKVQFHWDRQGQRNDQSSCWIRVSQPWGGAGQGGMFIPRVGQEVVVQFLEGDPDRPLVVGRVYNGENPVPHGLPANKNISTIRSASTPGGGGFNEIKFNDSAGGEELFIHAQKDQNQIIGNNHATSVGVDQSLSVGSNQSSMIGANQSLSVGGNRDAAVKGNESQSVTGSQSVSVNGGQSVAVNGGQGTTVTGGQSISVSGGQSVDVAGGQSTAVSGGQSLNVTGGQSITVAGGQSTTITGSQGISVSDNLGVSVAANTSIQSGSQIGLQSTQISITGLLTGIKGLVVQTEGILVGTSGVVISVEGAIVGIQGGIVSISGSTVSVSGSTVGVQGDGTVSVAGGTVSVEGGSVAVQGGVVTIN